MDGEPKMNWRNIGWAALACLCIAASQAADTNVIQITAKRYEFQPNVIRIKKGDHVNLIVTAIDRDHGFKLEALHIEEKLVKGRPVEIEFTADQTGTFPFQCSRFCGMGHGKMKGELIVE
jgi:cytochrome c oxidase subunit II